MALRPTLALALSLAACSSYNRVGADAAIADLGGAPDLPFEFDRAAPPDTPTAADVPTTADAGLADVGVGFSCVRLCRRLNDVAGCTAAYTGCVDRCNSDSRGFPARCMSQYTTLFNCVETTSSSMIECGATGMFPFRECGPANMTAVMCAMQ